jgi:hypothetical protein
MSPTQAGALSQSSIDKSIAGEICAVAFRGFQWLLWKKRRFGFDRIQISYREIAETLHIPYPRAVAIVDQWCAASLVRKVKNRVRVWIDGVRQYRQAANTYIFLPPGAEFAERTVKEDSLIKEVSVGAVDNGDNGENSQNTWCDAKEGADKKEAEQQGEANVLTFKKQLLGNMDVPDPRADEEIAAEEGLALEEVHNSLDALERAGFGRREGNHFHLMLRGKIIKTVPIGPRPELLNKKARRREKPATG